MLMRAGRYAARGVAMSLIVLGTFVVLPGITGHSQPFNMAVMADDDDDGDDDDGGSSNSGGRGGRSDGGGSDGRSDDRPAPRGDLRSLFRWLDPKPKRPVARAAPAVPDRSPNEIVAFGLNETTITDLSQSGFVVGERTAIQLTGEEVVRLTIPQGMTLDAARQAVSAAAPSAVVDVNHFYQPQRSENADCAGRQCKLMRALIGWPSHSSADSCSTPSPIGLVDTAINANHDALSEANIEVIRLAKEDSPRSGEQHGTAVAALLVGAPGSRAPGLLPSSRLVAVDAFQRYRGSADVADAYDLVRAIDILAAREIKVINLSLTGPSNLLLERIVDASISGGMILVAAAGNDGPNAKPVYPAAYSGVVAVTAVDSAARPYRRAVRGDHIDIAAPGVNVWTAASVSGARQKSGTSFAAPFVTAAISILAGTRPDLSPREIEAELLRSADDIGQPGRDNVYGWGLINARLLCQS